ncbi:uncharacterized protein N7518_009695 [Penicillium psychrosexuale]|uniref:uncharacterized protein n=1 Tax=Penicillium psychrosexuale TaxID=1002107 RepID=UPI0025458E1C|nr:uncharacterized protein N7518_009695 [Penicillium psychrosexuale]KAJ5784018.1 hypothetical protein N7518_009695 [Penicillium psychrosexuale]
MRLVNLAALACAVISASAFDFPEFVPLHRRQEAGTPAYECHANCGGVIVDGRTDGYCDTDDFTTELAACLECAVEYDIWQYYGTSVSKAATACGLDATPVEASSTTTSASATTTSASVTTASDSETTTSDSASTTETAEESVASAESTAAATTSASTSIATTSTASSTPSSTPVYTGGAMINMGSGLVSGAVVGCLLAAFL